MSELLIFITVLVSSPLNIKIWHVKLLQCLLHWDSSCARNNCSNNKNEKRLLGGILVTVRVSILFSEQACVSQVSTIAVV